MEDSVQEIQRVFPASATREMDEVRLQAARVEDDLSREELVMEDEIDQLGMTFPGSSRFSFIQSLASCECNAFLWYNASLVHLQRLSQTILPVRRQSSDPG